MGKASRNKQQSARERVAAQRAAERQRQNRNRWLITIGSVVVVAAVVVVIVFARGGSGPSQTTTSPPVTGVALPASVVRDVTTVPASALDTVGSGSVLSVTSKPVTTLTGSALTKNGKPEMLYIGAEFCPYCAAMRWSMAVALSRFGTLSPLRGIHSAPKPEAYPDTATITFYKTTYTSTYLAFSPVENETVDHKPLQATTAAQQRLWNTYDPNSYPFIDIGNKYMFTVLYDPAVLAGKTWSQIATAMRDPSSPVAKGVLGAANYLTAGICKVTGNSPAGVCNSAAVTSLQGKF